VGFAVFLIIIFLRRNANRSERRRRSHWLGIVVPAVVIAMILFLMLNATQQNAEEDDLILKDAGALQQTEVTLPGAQAIDDSNGDGASSTEGEGRSTAALLQFLLAGVAVVVVGVLVAQLRRRGEKNLPHGRAEEILAPVRAAITFLRQGRNPTGVVEECYGRMLRAMAERSGIDPSALTPREFVRTLERVGIARDSISELSRLFEIVHYGHREERDLAESALRCMTEICAAFPAPEEATT
jgi:hypothetical protein